MALLRHGNNLPDARKRLDETAAGLAASREIVAFSPSDRAAIAARQYAGEISESAAQKDFAEVDERERFHRSEVDRLGRLHVLIEDEIAALEHAGELAAHADAVAQVKAAQASAVAASETVAKRLRDLLTSAEKLEHARAAVDAAVVAADELHVDGAGDLPTVDEPNWLDNADVDDLIELLRAGPMQPTASGAADSAAHAAERERRDRELIEPIAIRVLSGGGSRLDVERLPEDLQPRAWARIAQLRDLRKAQLGGQDHSVAERSGAGFVRVG